MFVGLKVTENKAIRGSITKKRSSEFFRDEMKTVQGSLSQTSWEGNLSVEMWDPHHKFLPTPLVTKNVDLQYVVPIELYLFMILLHFNSQPISSYYQKMAVITPTFPTVYADLSF